MTPRLKITDADYKAALHRWCLKPSWEEVKARAKMEAARREQRAVLDRMLELGERSRLLTGDAFRRCMNEWDAANKRCDELAKVAFPGQVEP